jgi:hypothetical protein
LNGANRLNCLVRLSLLLTALLRMNSCESPFGHMKEPVPLVGLMTELADRKMGHLILHRNYVSAIAHYTFKI